MSGDVIVDEVRRVRDQLVKRYGGLEGWIEHLQSMDRQRAGKSPAASAKRAADKTRNRRKRPARARNRRAGSASP